MTRPEQPQEYGAKNSSSTPRPNLRRDYSDPLGRSVSGVLRAFPEGSLTPVVLPLVNGTVEAHLPAGNYRLVAEVVVDGVTRYLDDQATVGRYT